MENKIYAYRFDEELIKLLDVFTGLERTTKNMIIRKAVMNYLAENIDRLEQRYKKMKKMGLWV